MNRGTIHIFSVHGTFRFPIDMLRYDRAWPRTEADARKIEDSFRPNAEAMTVDLASLDEPNTARWQSFMWSVKDHVEASLAP